ncbi:hypothetical protein ABKN59_011936 [Abortiporus biennis]
MKYSTSKFKLNMCVNVFAILYGLGPRFGPIKYSLVTHPSGRGNLRPSIGQQTPYFFILMLLSKFSLATAGLNCYSGYSLQQR